MKRPAFTHAEFCRMRRQIERLEADLADANDIIKHPERHLEWALEIATAFVITAKTCAQMYEVRNPLVVGFDPIELGA